MIIYFPVSALVTLFANILQNPQDTRARSDLKLMNLVVSFLSMLCSEEENGSNGSVRRMLSVCSEFERIAKVVLDKADKESTSRRKRKQQQEQSQSQNGDQPSLVEQQQAQQARPRQQPTAPHTPGQQTSTIPNPFTPNFGSDLGDHVSPPHSPPLIARTDTLKSFPFTPNPTASTLPNPNWLSDFSPPQPGATLPPNTTSFADMQYAQATANANNFGGMDMGSTFQHPFVPQDLWQMPMTLEWDWADMAAGAGLGFEEGGGMNGLDGGVVPDGQANDGNRQQEQR